jgi:competence protein ComEC
MKRPFCIVALLYLAGIVLGDLLPANLPLLFFLGLTSAAVALFCEKGRSVLLAAALVFAGWFNLARHSAILSPYDVRLLLGPKPELVRVRGTLAASPIERIFERHSTELWRSTALLEVRQLQRGTHWQSASGRISVTTQGILDEDFFSGQTVEICGVARPPPPPTAPGLFDARSYLRQQGVYYQLSATTNDWQIWPSDTPQKKPLAARFHAWAKETLGHGLPTEDKALRLTCTLMLDWCAPMTQSVKEPFVRAGTFHIFAVDGLRIGMISAILLLFFRVLQIPREISGWGVIPVIWFYAGLTGFPWCAIRASIMMTVIILGRALRRPCDLLNSLFAAAFIILIWDPRQLFLPGFQLSFLVVFCIAVLLTEKESTNRFRCTSFLVVFCIAVLLTEKESTNGFRCISFLVVFCIAVLIRWLELVPKLVFRRDPMLPDQLKRHPPLWLSRIGWFGCETFDISVAAWFGSLPLAACYFHIFNWISVPANCLVVPLTMLALASNLSSLAVGAFWPFGTELFNYASWFLMNCIIDISQWFSNLPGTCFNVSSPSLVTSILFYALLVIIGSEWILGTTRKYQAWIALGSMTVLIGQQAYSALETRMDILSLKGGHAIYVSSPSPFKDNLLVDCGNVRPSESTTQPFLRAQGVNHLSMFCLSDASQRQMGGAALLSTNFTFDRVAFSPARARSPGYKQFTAAVGKTPNRRQLISDGDSILGWTVLSPASSTRLKPADDNAVVLRKEINGVSVLLLSDLSRAGQRELLERHPDLRADILIAGLPARDEPVCDWFLDAVKPRWIVIADSESPAPRRASPKLRERLARQSALFCSDTGALTFVFSPFGWHVETTDGHKVSLNSLN